MTEETAGLAFEELDPGRHVAGDYEILQDTPTMFRVLVEGEYLAWSDTLEGAKAKALAIFTNPGGGEPEPAAHVTSEGELDGYDPNTMGAQDPTPLDPPAHPPPAAAVDPVPDNEPDFPTVFGDAIARMNDRVTDIDQAGRVLRLVGELASERVQRLCELSQAPGDAADVQAIALGNFGDLVNAMAAWYASVEKAHAETTDDPQFEVPDFAAQVRAADIAGES